MQPIAITISTNDIQSFLFVSFSSQLKAIKICERPQLSGLQINTIQFKYPLVEFVGTKLQTEGLLGSPKWLSTFTTITVESHVCLVGKTNDAQNRCCQIKYSSLYDNSIELTLNLQQGVCVFY